MEGLKDADIWNMLNLIVELFICVTQHWHFYFTNMALHGKPVGKKG